MTAAVMAMIALPLVVVATLIFTSWAEETLLREEKALPRSGEAAPTGGASG